MQRNLVRILSLAALVAFILPSAALAEAAAGKAPYDTNCVSCHGPTGKGDGPVGAVLNPPPRDFSKGDFKFDTNGDGNPGTDEDLTNVIKKGASAYGGSALMAPWPALSDGDIKNIVAYIRSLKQ
ncbi:MAG: cytochrome c [Deltaproteobacteria bacterium]|nr:cytochrome c [Deltaproteobacteria bacterium]MBW2419205.1 cytochrome c [Deltaproteobacteria bacterium]